MKKILILLLSIISLTAIAQRKRITATFDADTTRPEVGKYGITVIKNQPYLVPNSGRAQRIDVSPLFIPTMSFGSVTTSATLPLDYEHIIIARDSTHITFPSKAAAGAGKRYYITAMGLRAYTSDTVKRWMPYNNTFYLSFSDTIFCRVGDLFTGTTYFTTYLTNSISSGSYNRPSFFRIYQNSSIYLELIQNRWYLFFADLKF